jgi:hypothetical protein
MACLVLFVALAFGPRLAAAQAPSVEQAADAPLTVMTYNLKFASANPPNAWPTRRPLMREVILQVAPDVFGTQEGLYEQLKDMAADLPEYDWIGSSSSGTRISTTTFRPRGRSLRSWCANASRPWTLRCR